MEGLIRVAPDDPTRCKTVTALGQCLNMATFGDCCPMHARGLTKVAEREEARNYRLGKFQARVNQFADSEKIKSLREEIGIIRMLIEEVLNRCTNTTELLLYAGKISDLIEQANRLVTSCHKLEMSTGMLLDKTAILQLGITIVEIVHKYVPEEKLDVISDEIVHAVMKAQPLPDET